MEINGGVYEKRKNIIYAALTARFQEKIVTLYSEEDYRRGYIISKDRHGIVEKFRL